MHMGSYKSFSFFQVGDMGWFHTFTEFRNRSNVGCSFRSCAAEIMVARLLDNFRVSHLVAKFEPLEEPELTAKIQQKMFVQDCWLKDHAYREWVLKDELDKHYAWCVASKIQLIFLCPLLLPNFGPYKSLYGSSPNPWEPCSGKLSSVCGLLLSNRKQWHNHHCDEGGHFTEGD